MGSTNPPTTSPPTPTPTRSTSSPPITDDDDDDHPSSSLLLESSSYVQVFNPSPSDHLKPQSFNHNVHPFNLESDPDAWLNLSCSTDPDRRPTSTSIHDPIPDHNQSLGTSISPSGSIQSQTVFHPYSEDQNLRTSTHPQLDLSCVNSDDTEASLSSLFSFPDPLNSVDHVLQSDHYDSAWFARYDNNITAPIPSPRSDHHSSLSSDQLDSKSSPSPSLTDTDLQSHSSFSSPTLPLFPEAGSDLSHSLHVYLCGNQLSESQLREILLNLRLNFSPVDPLTPSFSPTPPSGSSSGWKWSNLTRHRFRNAVSSALLKSPRLVFSISTRDLMYQTSWLEIKSSDLTLLSEHQQFSYLSSLPEKSALIIYATHSSDCFPTRWLNKLSLTCPTRMHFFKCLPVVIDENKSILQTFFNCFQFLCGLKSTETVKPSAPECMMVDNLSPDLFLEQYSNFMDCHLLRPRDLGLMSAPSVSKLNQLLMPFEPSSKPVEGTTSATSSKLFALLACLLAIVAASFAIPPSAIDLHTTQSNMRVAESPFLHTAEGQTNEILEVSRSISNMSLSQTITKLPSVVVSHLDFILRAKDFGVAVTPSPTASKYPEPRKASEAMAPYYLANIEPNHFPIIIDRNVVSNSERVSRKDETVDGENTNTQLDTTHSSSTHKPTGISDSTEPKNHRSHDRRYSKQSSLIRMPHFESTSSRKIVDEKSKCPKDFINVSGNLSNHLPPSDSDNFNSKVRKSIDNSFNQIYTKLAVKNWTRQLPKRLRKGLFNLQSHPHLCLKKIYKSTNPFISTITVFNRSP